MNNRYQNSFNVLGNQQRIVNVFLVYLLVFVSGSWRYNLSQDKFLVIGFAISFLAWCIYSERKISHNFILYVTVFASLLFSLSLYTDGSLSIQSVISSLLKFLLAYFVLRTVGKSFVDTYVQVIVVLAVFSLFGYFTDRMGLFDEVFKSLPRVGDMGYEGFLYVYRFPWHIERNNSIFFEPGAYQAFLNAGMFLLLFVDTNFSEKKKWAYMAVLIAALVTTFSTTGYLIFLVMFPVFLLKSNLVGFAGKLRLVTIGVIMVGALSAQFYSTFIVKFSDYFNANEYEFTYSAQSRASNAKADLKILQKHIFGLGIKDYGVEFRRAGRVGDEQSLSSNGVTRMMAVYGLPFALFLFVSYFWSLKYMLKNLLLAGTAYVMFILFLAGESYYMSTPICYAIIASAFVYREKSGGAMLNEY